MPVKPLAPRHTVEDLGSSLLITIPSPRKWFLVIHLIIQVLVWVLMEVIILGAVIIGIENNGYSSSSAFIGIWLILFTLMGFFALYALLWQLAGREEVEVNTQSITIRHVLFGLNFPKEYSSNYFKDIRISIATTRNTGWPFMFESWGLGGGTIAFDYGAKTYRLANSLDEAEAKQIIAEIQQKFPQYKN